MCICNIEKLVEESNKVFGTERISNSIPVNFKFTILHFPTTPAIWKDDCNLRSDPKTEPTRTRKIFNKHSKTHGMFEVLNIRLDGLNNFICFSEMCDELFKMCDCIDVPVIYDMTILTTNASFYGINDTAVNSSLNAISTWDAEAVKLACKSTYIFTFEKAPTFYIVLYCFRSLYLNVSKKVSKVKTFNAKF